MAKSSKMSFHSVPKVNKALTAEIRDFVQQGQDASSPLNGGSSSIERSDGLLEPLLEKLYVHICEFGRYSGNAATPDETILKAWESFLEVISEGLTAVKPHGYMIAARMTLYLAQAYQKHGQLPGVLPCSSKSIKPIALRCNFAIALDDLLLSCLTQIWSQSDKRDLFKWVFTNYPVKACACYHDTTCQAFIGAGSSVKDFHEQRRKDHIKAACITDPARLTPENGVHPRERWTRPQGDTTQYPRHPDASWVGYEQSANGERMLMWQDIGSDGPIMGSYHYRLVDDDTRESFFRERSTLRRSRQFIMDARKISEYNLARDSRRLAQMAMASNSLPAELQLMVFEYLDEINEPIYLGKIDLLAVYRPFPDISKKCCSCSGRASNLSHRMAKVTCPLNSITIWSLPLRAFHTFHQVKDGGEWRLCPDIDCAGHHRDSSWQVKDISIDDHLDRIVQFHTGQRLAAIKEIGLGPLEPAEVSSAAADRDREQRLFSGCREYRDDESREDRVEARWGGVTGLVNVMLHDETLLGLHTSGRTSTGPSWLLGRTRQEEYRARVALARDHKRVRCDFC